MKFVAASLFFASAAAFVPGHAPRGFRLKPLAAQEDILDGTWAAGTATRTAIEDFVASCAGIPEQDKIAVFDNDGTLWSEQPFYFQLIWGQGGTPQYPVLDFRDDAAAFLATTNHEDLYDIHPGGHDYPAVSTPVVGAKCTDLTYAPMIALLDYLSANGFKNFIVSGGGIEFVRVFAQDSYKIPTDQVVGSSFGMYYDPADKKVKRIPKPEDRPTDSPDFFKQEIVTYPK